MTGSAFERLLEDRALAAGIPLDRRLVPPLDTYFRLLAHWNQRINLTALALDPPSPHAVDRLLLEPIAAAAALRDVPPGAWFDVGSGGGSPALPLSLCRPDLALTMVEVRERKAAFLRAVVRELQLGARVLCARFEQVDATDVKAVLMTTRAVRPVPEFCSAAAGVLASAGTLAIFGGPRPTDPRFEWADPVQLLPDPASQLFRGRLIVPRETTSSLKYEV